MDEWTYFKVQKSKQRYEKGLGVANRQKVGAREIFKKGEVDRR